MTQFDKNIVSASPFSPTSQKSITEQESKEIFSDNAKDTKIGSSRRKRMSLKEIGKTNTVDPSSLNRSTVSLTRSSLHSIRRRMSFDNRLHVNRDSIKQSFSMARFKPIGARATYEQLNLVFKRILNQDLFDYSWKLIPFYYLKCLCCRSNKTLKKVSKRDFYLKRGTRKLSKDMDIVNLVRMLAKVRIMNSILFTEFR